MRVSKHPILADLVKLVFNIIFENMAVVMMTAPLIICQTEAGVKLIAM